MDALCKIRRAEMVADERAEPWLREGAAAIGVRQGGDYLVAFLRRVP